MKPSQTDPRTIAHLVLLTEIAGEALQSALELLRAGGFRPSDEQLRAISKILSDPEFLNAAFAVGLDLSVPPAAVLAAAREQGRRAVRDVLGAPLH